MSISVGSMSAGLGLDMSEFQRGMQAATEVARSNSRQMSAEMKVTAREGAEAWRLIDESLGIHVSRPLTRLVTQEFPGFASAMQSLLGGAVFGALATVGVEAIRKVSESISKAGEANEKWNEASRKSEEVFGDAVSGIEKKIAEVNGLPLAVKFNMEGAELARHSIDAVADALQREAKAAEEAGSLTTRAWNGLGSVLAGIAAGAATLLPDALGGDLATKFLKDSEQAKSLTLAVRVMKENLDDALRADAANGTHTALGLINEDLARIQVNLRLMQKAGNDAGTAVAESAQKLFEDAKQIEEATGKLAAAQTAKAASDEALKEQADAATKLSALYKEMGSSLAKLQPETDPIKKLESEIAGFRSAAEGDFRAIGESAASALATSSALAGLDAYEKRLDDVQAKLEADVLEKQAEALFSKPLPGGAPTGVAGPPLPPAPSPALPTLGAGGAVAAQYDVFKNDQVAQLKAAAAAYQDAITPQQKYDLAQSELNLLLDKGLISQQAYTAALQKASDEMAKSETHLRGMQEELAKLLEKTDSAAAGTKAFFLQLQIDGAQTGKFTFDLLNTGLQGFENNTVQALTGGRAQWRKYFEELDQMALKFALNKLLTGGLSKGPQLLQSLLGGGPGAPAPALPPTAPGSATGLGANALPGIFNLPKEAFSSLPSLLPNGSSSANTTALATAGTTLTTAGTMLTSAAAALQAAASALGTTGLAAGSGAGSSFNPLSLTAFGGGLATGGDLTPGASYVVGEQGPEPLSVDASGQAFISPHSSLRETGNSGGTHNHFYDLRGTDPGVVQRLLAALPQVEERAVQRAVATSSEIQRRSNQ